MDRREELHRVGCSFAKQTILTSHPSGLRARVSVELASVDSVCLHHISSPLKTVHGRSTDWEMGSPFMARRGGLSHHGTPVLGRRSDMVTEGRLSQQCTPVMRRKELMDSPAGSPLLSRRMDMEDTGDECSDVDTSVISGWLKFRDSKRWKSRWGVVTKLSPAADCLHLQLYRDPKDRYKRGQSKASLSLQHFLGFESSFTLDKESNTIAIICQDVTVVLAFETRERLIAWQVKVGSQLGTPRQFLVMVGGGGGGRTLPAGPARLHLLAGRVAVTAGVPPTLLGLWELAHLRRYGVVDGRFCFEGGSQCGKGEGLHVLLTDQAHDVAEAFRHAAEGHLHRNTHGSRNSTTGTVPHRPDTRLSDFNVEQTGSEGSALYEEGLFEGPEREVPAPWSGDDVTLERCGGCAECAGGGGSAGSFTPAWTMEGVTEPQTLDVDVTSYVTSRPARHPPPPRPDQCGCSSDSGFVDNPKVGPYENYDVPKTTPVEVENAEYYDTPKRIKEVLADDLFRVTNASPGSLVLKKNCGCILRLAPKRDTKVSRNEDRLKPAECACQRVTSWASSLIRLPYCRKKLNNDSDNIDGDKAANEDTAIYATVDVSRKTNRQSNHSIGNVVLNEPVRSGENVQGVNDKNNPYANYENLDFAMSLEYYENAKDLLKKAGVTQKELDALSTNFKTSNLLLTKTCSKCGHSQPNESKQDIPKRNKSDEYLLMEPSSSNEIKHVVCNKHGQTLGYTSMSPISNRCHSLKNPPQKSFSVEIEKSSSIPAFYGSKQTSKDVQSDASQSKNRSSSVDSARLLEDLKEFDGSIGSRATSSSLETLRNMAIDNRPSSEEGYEQDWCGKSSSSDHKTESSTDSKEVPNLRNKLIDNAQIKRSSSVPCKSGGNRDSSSSNDSGVSSCSLRLGGPEFGEYGSSPTSGRARQYSCRTRALREVVPCVHASLPRKSKSTELREVSMQLPASAKSSSAEAEVPVLPPKQIRGVMDSRSTSSGTSDMSDYIETLSLSSEHSLSDTHAALRQVRQATSTLRPRSGGEYHQMDAARARAHAAHTPHAPHAMARVPPTFERVTEPQTLDVDVTSYVTSRPARLPPPPRPDQCGCSSDSGFVDNPKVGPYENYDVPKTTPVEVENAEYYDTPKRIKEVLADDLFRVTNASPGSLVLKKNCGCILRLAPKRDTKVSRNEDRLKPAECACQRVTSWASSLIRLPYCRKKLNNDSDNIDGDKAANEDTAIYATVDVSRKTNRQSNHSIGNVVLNEPVRSGENVQGVNDKNNPYANYENLDFAMSLEYYENAKDLLKKAGVTQKELDALSTNFKTSNLLLTKTCSKCGHSQPNESKQDIPKRNKSDEYLLMEPSSSNEIKHVVCNKHGQTLGYTPMSPISNRCHSLKHPPQKSFSVEIEKSSSIPAFYGSKQTSKDVQSDASQSKNRSSSVDSARLLEDLKEFDGSIGSRATSSSLETLRNMAIDNRPSSEEGYEQDWCGKSSSSDHKTESSTDSKEVPNLRNKLIDNAQIKRSSSVPCKSGGNRDSSSSNDSGVSSCSLRLGGPEFGEYGSSGRARQYSCRTRALREVVPCVHASLPRKSKSTELREVSMQLPASAKSSSAEAEVPVLPPKQIRGVMDSRSTSSGTSDMSDYIETLSLSSEHSLSDTHAALRQVRQATSTLRPRSGGEYHQMDAARARAHAAHTPHAPHAMARVPPTFER